MIKPKSWLDAAEQFTRIVCRWVWIADFIYQHSAGFSFAIV